MPYNHQQQTSLRPSLEGEATQRTLQLISQANQAFELSIQAPSILFDLKGQTAGMVKFLADGAIQIRYNRKLLEKNQLRYLAQTLPHEVAHIVARAQHGRQVRPHGHEWRSVMVFFGAEPLRCHSYDVSGITLRKLKRFNYKCQCKNHQLTTIRHNRVRRGQTYICRSCATALIPAPSEPPL